MSSEFESLLEQPISPETETLLLPDRPIAKRLCYNLKKQLSGNSDSGISVGEYDLTILALSKLLTPSAYKIIERPISFSEYLEKRRQSFRWLIDLWNKYYEIRWGGGNVLESNDHDCDFRHDLLSAILTSTGILSREETFRSRGIDWDGFQEDQISPALRELNRVRYSTVAKVITYEGAKGSIERLSEKGLTTAIYIGVFDLDHEGHKGTAVRAKRNLGPHSKLFCAVVDKKLSILQKGKEPTRDLDRRMANMSMVKGIDRVFPIVLPDSVQSLEDTGEYFLKVHEELAPHVRIVGNPTTIDTGLWEVYQKTCRQANVLLVYNDELKPVSTTSEINRIRGI